MGQEIVWDNFALCPQVRHGSGKRRGSSGKSKPSLFEPAVGHGGTDLKDTMSTHRRPAHLTLLVHAGIDEAVGVDIGCPDQYRRQ